MKTLTIICPVYQEEAVIADFYDALKKQLRALPEWDANILFVIDRSSDRTLSIVREIARHDASLGVIGMSARFGHQMALLAGIDHAKGDVIIMMDSDLQHPPAVIPLLLAEYEKGNDVVYTIREGAAHVPLLRRLMGNLFYRFINMLSEVPINPNAADFRLISRRVADVIRNGVRERNVFLRGIISWVGFNQASVRFIAAERSGGKSKYSFSRLLHFAIFGIISFSKKPLRAASVTGFFFALFGFCVALVAVVQYFTDNALPSGWATLVVLLSVFGGVQLIFLGIIGEYIGAIFDEVKGRPHYIIEDAINLAPEESAG